MDKERLLRFLNQKYISKCEMAGSLPLGCNVNEIWNELLEKRYDKAIMLPLNNTEGKPYWYILTTGMISASENIVEELMEHSYDNAPQSISSLEETFFTGYMEGAQISIQDAMAFLQSGEEPHDIEELMILNNRQAGTFAAENLLHPIDENYLHNLAYILTNGLDNGGGDYRASDSIEIPSMNKEKFTVPAAIEIPKLVKEFSSFLADTQVHPLIKSAVAQAWIMIVRPFPEGNERLARLLSSIILIRSGYSFFSEISLSSLIARQSFEYFKAVANVIRLENSSDLTYFLDYYIQLLSTAVNTLKERRRNKEEETHEAECELAQVPLSPTPSDEVACKADSVHDDFPTKDEVIMMIKNCYNTPSSTKNQIPEFLIQCIQNGADYITSELLVENLNIKFKTVHYHLRKLKQNNILKTVTSKNKNYYYFAFVNITDELVQTAKDESPKTYTKPQSEPGRGRIINFLTDISKRSSGAQQKKIADLLLTYMNQKHYKFTSGEIHKSTQISIKSINNNLRIFVDKHIIKVNSVKKHYNVYEFTLQESKIDVENKVRYEDEKIIIEENPDYSYEILQLINELEHSHRSLKDRRLGEALHKSLNNGIVDSSIYGSSEADKGKYQTDMIFAKRLGLVENNEDGTYSILRKLKEPLQQIDNSVKETISLLYDFFGEDAFSFEMVTAKLDYSPYHINVCLHQFTWMKILGRKRNDDRKYIYQFLINPTDNPECFKSAA